MRTGGTHFTSEDGTDVHRVKVEVFLEPERIRVLGGSQHHVQLPPLLGHTGQQNHHGLEVVARLVSLWGEDKVRLINEQDRVAAF
jgi:hypothetical protein